MRDNHFLLFFLLILSSALLGGHVGIADVDGSEWRKRDISASALFGWAGAELLSTSPAFALCQSEIFQAAIVAAP